MNARKISKQEAAKINTTFAKRRALMWDALNCFPEWTAERQQEALEWIAMKAVNTQELAALVGVDLEA